MTQDPCGDRLFACGISWDSSDIARFLRLCVEDHSSGCLIWAGAKSRGRGNTAWYGSFGPTGQNSVRAHKFYGVAVLGLRPQTELHHLDHLCPNSLCVRHIECVPISVNLKLRWIRIQVGADPELDYNTHVRLQMQQFLTQRGPAFFGSDARRLWTRWQLPESTFCPDPFDPRFWDPGDTGDHLLDALSYAITALLPTPVPDDPPRSASTIPPSYTYSLDWSDPSPRGSSPTST